MLFIYIIYFLMDVQATVHYKVNSFANTDIKIDGNNNEPAWERCNTVKHLLTPWHKNERDSTLFRACYDTSFFYFVFSVRDPEIVVSENGNEIDVAKGDRVELFFCHDTLLNNYYCIEISPDGKFLDYQASYYRKFNYKWQMKGVSIAARRTKGGYVVEGRIPVSFFQDMLGHKDLAGHSLRTGIFRAQKNMGSGKNDFIWHSWVDPKVAAPDFHVPSAFGAFEFQ